VRPRVSTVAVQLPTVLLCQRFWAGFSTMAELNLLLRDLKKQKLAEEKQNQQSCCIIEKRSDNHNDLLCNSVDSSSHLRLTSSFAAVQEKSLATRDVQTKLLQILASSDDDEDVKDDLLARAEIFFEEKKKRELQSSQSASSFTNSRGNYRNAKRTPPPKGVEVEERDTQGQKEGQKDVSKMDDGRHTEEIVAKNTKHSFHNDYKSSERKAKETNNDDDSESSEDLLENYIHHMNQRKNQDQGKLQKQNGQDKETKMRSLSSRKKYFQSSIEDALSDDSDDKIVKPCHQPLRLKSLERNVAVPHDHNSMKRSGKTDDYDDALWDDEIDTNIIYDNSVEKKFVRKSCRRIERNTNINYSGSFLEGSGKQVERKARTHIPDNSEKTLLDLEDIDENELEHIYPEIDNPRLGPPGPLIPLELSGTKETESVYFVPPSINRYLADFQREGVQFLYSRLSMGMGAILGKSAMKKCIIY